jgi:hypothetical protein
MPALTDEQLRSWALVNLKDSRFMHLPADMLRVLIHYVGDMSVVAFKESQEYRAMAYLWECVDPVAHECELCHGFGLQSDALKYKEHRIPITYGCCACDRKVCSYCINDECINCEGYICPACVDDARCVECDNVGCKPCRNINMVCDHNIQV